MTTIIFNFLFALVSILVLLKVVGYGIYEFKEKENKTGGIAVIVFSLIVVIFTNIVLFMD